MRAASDSSKPAPARRGGRAPSPAARCRPPETLSRGLLVMAGRDKEPLRAPFNAADGLAVCLLPLDHHLPLLPLPSPLPRRKTSKMATVPLNYTAEGVSRPLAAPSVGASRPAAARARARSGASSAALPFPPHRASFLTLPLFPPPSQNLIPINYVDTTAVYNLGDIAWILTSTGACRALPAAFVRLRPLAPDRHADVLHAPSVPPLRRLALVMIMIPGCVPLVCPLAALQGSLADLLPPLSQCRLLLLVRPLFPPSCFDGRYRGATLTPSRPPRPDAFPSSSGLVRSLPWHAALDERPLLTMNLPSLCSPAEAQERSLVRRLLRRAWIFLAVAVRGPDDKSVPLPLQPDLPERRHHVGRGVPVVVRRRPLPLLLVLTRRALRLTAPPSPLQLLGLVARLLGHGLGLHRQPEVLRPP